MAFGKLGQLGRGFGGRLGGAQVAPVYDTDAATLFAAMTTPPTTGRKTLINNFIVGLKADNVWTPLDCLYLLAAETSQAGRLNVKAPATFFLNTTNTPTFVVDRGFNGDGSTSFLDGGFDPTLGGNFTLNNAHMGIYTRTADGVSSMAAMGNLTSRIGQSAANAGSRANDGTNTTAAQATVPKHYSWSRAISTSYSRYVNGVLFGATVSVTTTALTAAHFQVCASNGTFGQNQLAAVHFGSSLDATQSLAIYNRLLTYLTAVGAN